MKTLTKIIICIIVIVVAIGVAYLIANGDKEAANTNKLSSNISANSNVSPNKAENEKVENKDYIGIEENVEVEKEEKEETKQEEPKTEENNSQEQQEELTGEEKAINIVKKQYAKNGQTVRFDHMEGTDYIIKVNNGTAITWYLVDGKTWEAEEY